MICEECGRNATSCGKCTPKPKPRQRIKKKAYKISPNSKKRIAEDRIYYPARREFLSLPENQICFIDGCNRPSTTIEHTRGREGYADEEARNNGISLYIDTRYWKGCCAEHNGELERNPELSRKYQLSKIHGGKKQPKQ